MYAGPRGIIMAKTTFKINSIALTIEGNPVELNGLEITTEATAQELATAGGNINKLVEIIGDIAERFDNQTPVKEIEVKDVKPVEVKKPQPMNTDFCEIKVKEKTEKPKFSITKEWKKIQVPVSLKEHKANEYRWSADGIMGDYVSIDGSKFNVIFIIIRAMGKEAFVSVRADNVKFSNDICAEDFQDYIDVINIPEDIKDYIRKVVEL